jgi:hypothetical protein
VTPNRAGGFSNNFRGDRGTCFEDIQDGKWGTFNMRKLQRFTGYLLVAGLLAAASACTVAYGDGDYRAYRDPHRDYRSEIQRRAYGRGYDEGREHGRSDARNGRRIDYRRHDEFRDADEGYRRRDGDPETYREAFRRGFVAGYNEAYRFSGRDRDEDGNRSWEGRR